MRLTTARIAQVAVLLVLVGAGWLMFGRSDSTAGPDSGFSRMIQQAAADNEVAFRVDSLLRSGRWTDAELATMQSTLEASAIAVPANAPPDAAAAATQWAAIMRKQAEAVGYFRANILYKPGRTGDEERAARAEFLRLYPAPAWRYAEAIKPFIELGYVDPEADRPPVSPGLPS